MTKNNHYKLFGWIFIISILFPLIFWLQADLSDRTLLKDFFSVLTILSFCQMPGMVLWSRINRSAVKGIKKAGLIKIHKFIGYVGTAVLLLHPVLLVVPRFFESGVSPHDAFVTIVTTFNRGIVLGMLSWGLLLSILITSLIKKHLPISYKTWRTLHGALAACFILAASWHIIDLGRHSSMIMSIFIGLLTGAGILLFARHHFPKKKKKPLPGNRFKPVLPTSKIKMTEPV